MKLLPKWILLISACLLGGSSYAAMTYKAYRDAKKADEAGWILMRMYINGLGHGLQVANAELEMRNERQLYCAPPNLSMNQGNYVDLLESTLSNSKSPIPDNTDIDSVLLIGLQKTFPCKSE